MLLRLTALLLYALTCSASAFADAYTSQYIGEENRAIKSLSPDDIRVLQQGGGWGLAKAAELNGVPGPLHILEMASKINLTANQKSKIQALYDDMKAEAMTLGKQLIDLEKTLNAHFADRTINQTVLDKSIHAIAQVRAELRIVHLSAHLQTPHILTREQIRVYNTLRGYAKDPCAHIPEGHNAAMWKKHNGCH